MGLFKRRTLSKQGQFIIKVCPICGSDELSELNSLSGWYTQLQYICRKCGYSGTLILEVESESKEVYNEAFKKD